MQLEIVNKTAGLSVKERESFHYVNVNDVKLVTSVNCCMYFKINILKFRDHLIS